MVSFGNKTDRLTINILFSFPVPRQSGKYPDWCGYGPTEELKSCTIEDATDEGVSTTDSESSEFDAETGFDPAVESGLEPGPGEATSAGESVGVGSNQGLEPIDADKGTNTQPGTRIYCVYQVHEYTVYQVHECTVYMYQVHEYTA